MNSKHLIALLPAAAALIFGGILAAQPASSANQRYEKRDERRERRNERREQHREDRQDGADERRDRRHEKIAKLRERWGSLLQHPAGHAELKLHAWRMARLQALRRIAEKEGKTALLPRIDKLVQKEQARHDRHMNTLKSRGPAAPSASASYGGAQ